MSIDSPTTLTRREALKIGAAAALPLAAAAADAAPQAPPPQDTPTIGMATLGFGGLTNRQVAEEIAGQGLRTVQLFLNQSDSRYWKYNGRSDVSDLSAARCREIAAAYRSAGIAVHSIGVYANLVHPDEAERKANLDYFEAMMRIAEAMGVGMLVTEAGHYEPDKPAQSPYHFREDVWKLTVAAAQELGRRAEARAVTVLFEPYFAGFLASAKRTRLFLEEVGSTRIRALLDPANLLEVNDLEEMFEQLKPWIECLHAKDRKLHVARGVPAGQGDLDYRKFAALAARHTPNVPVILEYVGPKDSREALAHLRNAMQQAGLGPR